MKCPICGIAELIHDTRELPCTYKGETLTITAATGKFCPICFECILDTSESLRVMNVMCAFFK